MLDAPLDPGQLLSSPTTDDALSLMDQLLRWLTTSGVKIVVILLAASLISFLAGWFLRRFFRTMVQSGSKISTVTGTVIKNGKEKKVIVYKMHPKKNYRCKQCHRQPYTKVRIDSISL